MSARLTLTICVSVLPLNAWTDPVRLLQSPLACVSVLQLILGIDDACGRSGVEATCTAEADHVRLSHSSLPCVSVLQLNVRH